MKNIAFLFLLFSGTFQYIHAQKYCLITMFHDDSGATLCYLYDTSGNKLCEDPATWYTVKFGNIFKLQNNLYSMYDSLGNFTGLDSIQHVGLGYPYLMRIQDRMAYYNRSGSLAFPGYYSRATDFINGVACAWQEKKQYFFDSSGNDISKQLSTQAKKEFGKNYLPLTSGLHSSKPFEHDQYELKLVNGKYGVKHKTTGKMLLPCEYDVVGECRNQLFVVRKEMLVGLYHTQKGWILPCSASAVMFLD